LKRKSYPIESVKVATIMYVCLCTGVTEEQIRRAIVQGCHSIEMLREVLGVSTVCGACQEMITQILQESTTENDGQ
jgi:bacterioferritin-associated ferredoxin